MLPPCLCYDIQVPEEYVIRTSRFEEEHMLQQQLGAMQIDRIVEYQSSEYVRTSFFPQTTPADWAQHEAWMKPHAMDQETGNLTLVM